MVGLRGDLKEATGTFGAGIAALQTQLTHYQSNQDEKYLRRREAVDMFEEARMARTAQDERLQQQRERIDQLADQISSRGWMLLSAVIGAVLSAVFAAASWSHVAHP